MAGEPRRATSSVQAADSRITPGSGRRRTGGEIRTGIGPMGGSTGPDIRTKIATLSSEGIQRAIKTVYNRARRLGNLCPARIFPGLPQARAVTGILALACFATGFAVA